MNSSDLLSEVQRRGGSLSLAGDGFEYQGPAGSLPPDLRAELAAHKPVLLEYLRHQDADERPANGTEEFRLSHLFDTAPIQQVYSPVLGETVVFATDGAELPADLEGVVYRASELRQLPGKSPEQVRAIHAAKKTFDGEVIL